MSKSRNPSGKVWGLAGCLAALLAVLAWAAAPSAPVQDDLAAILPGGALMTVESTDFGALVAAWNHSPEQQSWLKSANYSAFANSRLFTRLADAQTGFAEASKSEVDGNFLSSIAGKESIFAWYNIGNLEFLYISRLPQDRLAKLSLLQQRSSFARREAGGTTFYVRTSSAQTDAGAGASSGDSPDTEGAAPDAVSQPRTVAFAVRGDWLLLATREDLIAGALQLMAARDKVNAGNNGAEAQEGWYAAAVAAGPAKHGDLHMLLDLQALTKTPQFRTYWLQRNVTDTRQYRAAVVDLYREPNQFREERVLLPMQPQNADVLPPDLGPLERLVPVRTGVYRAIADPEPATAFGALREKVLAPEPAPETDTSLSPDAQISSSSIGAAQDFDTRIDATPRSSETSEQTLGPLRHLLETAGLNALLTIDRSNPATAEDTLVRTSSAVVLQAANPWNRDALAAAVLGSLQTRLTTASIGLDWKPAGNAGAIYTTLGAPHPICLFVEGPLAVLSSDPQLMDDILQQRSSAPASPLRAQVIAGFRANVEAKNFRHLTADLNMQSGSGSEMEGSAPSGPAAVDLFRDNLPSLSDTFRALDSEHSVQSASEGKVHQSVLYRWSKE